MVVAQPCLKTVYLYHYIKMTGNSKHLCFRGSSWKLTIYLTLFFQDAIYLFNYFIKWLNTWRLISQKKRYAKEILFFCAVGPVQFRGCCRGHREATTCGGKAAADKEKKAARAE